MDARIVGDRYRLDAWLATGGLGQVWRAQDLALGRPVALNVLRPERAGDPEVIAPDRAEQPEQDEQPEQPEQDEQVEQPEQDEQAERTGPTGEATEAEDPTAGALAAIMSGYEDARARIISAASSSPGQHGDEPAHREDRAHDVGPAVHAPTVPLAFASGLRLERSEQDRQAPPHRAAVPPPTDSQQPTRLQRLVRSLVGNVRTNLG